MLKGYFINFDNPTDDHIRVALYILGKAGYNTSMRSGADGESWQYFTDREIDKETTDELKEIGVTIQ